MEDRVNKIIERIRRDLRKKGITVSDTRELYDECNRVQTFIIQDTKTVEREITIETEIGVEEYDFVNESAVTVIDFWNSWGGAMQIVVDESWSKKRLASGADPFYIRIANGKVKLSPLPIRANDVITFLVRQTDIINEMDDDVEPEIPSEFDEVLIKGVCSNYDDSFKPEYLGMLERAKGNTSSHSIPTHVNGVW